MIAIRRGPARFAVLACLLALTTSGCGLSAELERERDPDPKLPPSPSVTLSVEPPPAVTPEASPSVPVQEESGCPSSGVRFDTELVQGAMGLRATSLILTNCGSRPYELNGYPSIQVLDEAGEPLSGVRTVEGTDEVSMAPEDPGPEPLTLAPGESAYASLYWRMNNEKGIYLRVAPAKGREVTTVRAENYFDIGPENVLGTLPWKPME
ncbi:DUF4232 domain-containing protein [Streptomyces ureilyticus]|uniref:DUF4232 domain-containing protein n=1 Tax=Streptomyces ureilyticus TaxID=1775131 RepID=A0ABX0E909_9ACTN|nr:DUF4232 domain-containing protein [Streptomyces ureilyticus]NGO48256.1 DUF4232 domain-containing protein [Streptomyces ureilyticus]